jgi:hypothetical protein
MMVDLTVAQTAPMMAVTMAGLLAAQMDSS